MQEPDFLPQTGKKSPAPLDKPIHKFYLCRMNRLSLTLLTLTLSLLSFGQAQIKWLGTEHNFGAFNESVGKVTATFRFVNTGTEPLVITGARANCGCTTPVYPTIAVAPGDTSQVSVAFDSGGRPGRFDKKVYVDTNTEPSRSTLTIRGVVIGDEATVAQRFPVDMGALKLSRSAALLGIVSKGHLKNVYLNAYNATTDTVRPTVKDVPQWLDVTFAPKTVAPGEQTAVSFMVRSDRTPLYGVVADTVTIVADSATPLKTYRLPVVVTINEDFSKLTDKELRDAPVTVLSTQKINLDSIAAGKPAQTSFTIKNEGKTPLKIRRIYSTDPGIALDYKENTIKAGKSAIVNVTVTPVPDADIVNARISVITNDPVNPVQTVQLTALPISGD